MRSSEFKLMVMPYASRLYRLAFRMMGNREEAEDVVQEVYLKLWKMRNELPSYQSIEALAVRITRNLCLDLLRKRKKTLDVVESERREQESGRQSTPEDHAEKEEKIQLVHEMINRLPEPQRSLIHLRHIEGKEYDEIAAMVNMTGNAIRVNISRARKKLREMLNTQYSPWKN